jgi:hypothetical protein
MLHAPSSRLPVHQAAEHSDVTRFLNIMDARCNALLENLPRGTSLLVSTCRAHAGPVQYRWGRGSVPVCSFGGVQESEVLEVLEVLEVALSAVHRVAGSAQPLQG